MGDKYRVTIIGTYLFQTFNNVLNFDNTAAVLTPEQIADEVETEWVNRVSQMQSNFVGYTQLRVQPLVPGSPAAFTKTLTRVGQTGGSGFESSFICAVFKIQTATGGRHGRGRVYIPGLRSGDYFNNAIRADLVGQWQSIVLNNLNAAFNGNNGTSPLTLGVMGRAIGSTFHPMTNINLRSIVGLQRRRNTGVGI